MSTYYCYYLGYVKDEKIYPLGPFDDRGNLCCVVERSSNFASDLYCQFNHIDSEKVSSELDTVFKSIHRDYDDDYTCDALRFAYLEDLPKGSPMKSGYFLISEVARYLSDESEYNPASFIFSAPLDPITYNGMVTSELQFGRPSKTQDDFGTEYVPHSAGDYMFYMYEDTESEEYESKQLRSVAHMLKGNIDIIDIVVILEIG